MTGGRDKMRLNEIDFFSFISLDTKNYRVEEHKHDTYEINVILGGNMEVTVDDHDYLLIPGDTLIWDANSRHHNKLGSEGHAEFVTAHFRTDEKIPGEMLPIRHTFPPEKMNLINMFISEAKDHGTDSDSPAIPLLEAIVKMCLCKTQANRFSNDTSATVYGKAIRLMSIYSVQNIPKIQEMANLCGVSATTLKNTFKKQTGKSIKKYYNDLRIQYAKEMLLRGDSTKHVAGVLHFSSVTYFLHFFKNNTGMSIRDFLRQYKHNAK